MRYSMMALLAVAILSAAGPALADCASGNNSLPGSIGPGQIDPSRSYSVDGSAILTVAGAVDSGGNPVELEVTFPGHCQPRVGPTVSCTVSAHESIGAVIHNFSDQQVTYRWVCSGL